MSMVCSLCNEEVEPWEARGPTSLPSHRECGLRMALGGIGHLIDHNHYCLVMHDPDGGMSYRDSARLVAVWVELKGGIEALFDEDL